MKKVIFASLITFITMFMASTAFANLNSFSGKWENIDPNTRGITSLNIQTKYTRVTVQAWGQCHPTDCDWGSVKAYAYAPSVSSNLQKSAQIVFATFNTQFSQTHMFIRPSGRNRLQVEVLTHFTDNRKRTDYTNLYTFSKARLQLSAPRQLSPANGTQFNHYPRKTKLVWAPVNGAKSYTVEVDCYHCCAKGKWCTQVGRTHRVEHNIKIRSFTFNWVGAQKGRWRVWAVDAKGRKGPKSPWWTFNYSR